MEKGYWHTSVRVKEGAYDTIDNVTKFALSGDDYETYEEWVEYTEEQIANQIAHDEAIAKKAEQDEFLENAPIRMSVVETCISALTSAFGEVN